MRTWKTSNSTRPAGKVPMISLLRLRSDRPDSRRALLAFWNRAAPLKIAGVRNAALKGRGIACVIVAPGDAATYYAYDRTTRFPSIDDATIDADVVHVASPVKHLALQ